jgi:hypothetical protein
MAQPHARNAPKDDDVKLKLDDNGNAVVQDGKPVYVNDDGTETAVDVAATIGAVKARNTENKTLRERAEAAEAKVAAFGDLDAEAARKALEVVGKLDQKKLIEAGQMDQAIAAALKPVQDKLASTEATLTEARAKFRDAQIGAAFAGSKFLGETVMTPGMARAYFGSHFEVDENGVISAKHPDGQTIYGSDGKPASFDDALKSIVGSHPDKAVLLKATNASGSGAPAGGGGASDLGAKKAGEMTDSEQGRFIREKGLDAWKAKVSSESAKAA